MKVGEKFGRFTLLKRIAEGGMGELWLAKIGGREGFEKTVVIKTVLEHLAKDKHFLDMFLDEARICAQLSHPNICQVYELDQVEGIPIIVMEHLRGVDLVDLRHTTLDRGKRLPFNIIARIIADAAAGLHYAHEVRGADDQPLNLVHRDISPQNVFVTFDGAVKVIDFGIAKAHNRLSPKTQTGLVKGKYAYMSPEQTMGLELDRRSDIFALGTVFHEMLTNAPLFGGKSSHPLAVLKRVQDAVVAPPSVINREVPESLDAIVLKALQRDKESRYATMHELRMALEDWITHEHTGGSSAHLAAFLREAGVEQAQKEMLEAEPPEVSAHPILSDAGETPRVNVDEVRTKALGVLPPPLADTELGDTVPNPPARTETKKPIAFVAIATTVLIAGAGIGAIYFRSEPFDRTTLDAAFGAGRTAPATCRVADADVGRLSRALALASPVDALLGDRSAPSAERSALTAQAAIAVDRYDDARASAKDAAARCASWAVPHYLLGKAAHESDDLATAERSYRAAIERAADWDVPSFNLALVLLAKPEPKEAITLLDKVLGKNASFPRAHLIRGQAHLFAKNFTAASSDLQKALEENPGDAAATKLLAQAKRGK